MIIIIDNKDIIQYMNRTVPPYTPEEVVGKSIYDYIPIEQHEITKKTLESVFKEGKPKSYEISSVIPKKDIMWFFIKVIPIKQDGKVISVIEIVSDITERKKMITEIEDLAKFPSENPNPVMRIDNNGVLLYANDVSKSWIHKWKSGIGKPVPKAWIKHVNRVVKSSLNEFVEFEHDQRVYSFLFAPVVESNYVNVYGLDITELKIIEEELQHYNETLEELVKEKTVDLRESEMLYRSLVELSPEAIMLSTLEGKITQTNSEGATLFGFKSRAAMLATEKTIFDYMSPDDQQRALETTKKIMEEGKIRGTEFTMLKEDGSSFPVEMSV
jgi:PAS domain S-box-containing protein